MSHFAVMVVHKPGDDLEKILLPWHEYECTGKEDWPETFQKILSEIPQDMMITIVDCHI